MAATFGRLFLELGVISQEVYNSGVLEREIEYTIYVELKDVNELSKFAVSTEEHEQWNVPLANQEKVDGKFRIRLINNARPTMTTKIKDPNGEGCEEINSDISMAAFNHFKRMACDGYVKTRHIVPSNIPGLAWEIDVFKNQLGGDHSWVKVDLEVKSLADPIPTFPLAHSRMVHGDGDLTPTEKRLINGLWEREWCRLDK